MASYQSSARAETVKRLIAQLVNERLVTLTVLDGPDQQRARITGPAETETGDAPQWITLPVAESFNLSKPLRPNDFCLPVTLRSQDGERKEDDPGSIFAFAASWFRCDEETTVAITYELRNSGAMLEKWMELASDWPVLDINSSFLDWEKSLIMGHPTHPFHRTCFAHGLLQPVGPDDIPNMLDPQLSFVAIPRSSVRMFGPFEKLVKPLLDVLDIPSPDFGLENNCTVVPCLTQHLPALLHFFPEAILVKTVTNRAVAQASLRTVSVPGYDYDIKFSLACLITSALRVLPSWSAQAAPPMTDLLRKLIPEDLWLFGEVAAITGAETQRDASEARYITCILRENLELKAQQNEEALVLAAALMERPRGGGRTYAEILFGLDTVREKTLWFKGYIRALLPLALGPLTQHGVGFELHAQNSVIRICKRTKRVKGFAIRDLAGVKLHGPTLKDQGFDITNLGATVTEDIHQVWNRVHHALVQNHIGYLLYSLGLEGDSCDGWQIVHSELERVLSGPGSTAQAIFQYFVKETMPLKSFIRMRMGASFKSSLRVVEVEAPNVLWNKSPWLRQVSVAASSDAGICISPENTDEATRAMETKYLQDSFVRNVTPYGQPPRRLASQLNSHPAVLPKKFLEDVNIFHEALIIALDDIVDRWWTDKEADFPSRMPLEPRVEKLLRWIAQGSKEGFARPYKGNQGNLRPGILLSVSDAPGTFPFRVCEINGRFPINFLHFVATGYEALADTMKEWQDPFLKPASDHTKLFNGLLDLFDSSVPVHFLSESSDLTEDSPLYGLIEQRTGMRPRSIKPSSLRLVGSATSPTGFDLYCITNLTTHRNTNLNTSANANANANPNANTPENTPNRNLSPDLINENREEMEKVHQIALQLHDTELFSLSEAMIRQIALCCINDVRSVFISHDKRILGILRGEVDSLVHRGVLSEIRGEMLRNVLIPTILPSSNEVLAIREAARINPGNKKDFILKPLRLARGKGILLGKNLSDEEWIEILNDMNTPSPSSSSSSSSSPGTGTETEIETVTGTRTGQYILQPFLPLQTVNWFWDEQRKVRNSRMVGTYYSVNGQFLGLGPWRTGVASENVISASTKEVTTVMGVCLS